MKTTEFCYWLQGFFEIAEAAASEEMSLTAPQVSVIRNHLALVFKHDIDPKAGPPEYQAELQSIHDGVQPAPPPYRPGKELYRC